jgi:hypothetical protein
MSLKLHVVVHGAGPAFIRQPGCPCVRCNEPVLPETPAPQDLADLLAWARQAHTSVSLVIEEDGLAIDHTLVDIGMGVMHNLAALPTPARNQPVSRVLITHGHFDHIMGLDGLLHALHNGLAAGDFSPQEQPWPLPVYTTRRTWERYLGPNPGNPADAGMLHRSPERMALVDVTDAALALAALELHPALLVVPIPAEHLDGGVNFLVEFWPSGQQGEGNAIHIGLCWDLLAYPSGQAGEAWQGVALHPTTEPLLGVMRELDLLLVEMTNWRARPGHINFEAGPLPAVNGVGTMTAPYGVRELIAAWHPLTTRIMHYSGWNDRQLPDGTWQSAETTAHNTNPAHGPVSDRHLRRALRAALGDEIDCDIAQPGMVLTFA